MGRLNGKVVLAPFVLPGERVSVEAVAETKGLVRARLVEILEPSPHRAEPPCEYFGRCGGCHYQQAPYAEQLGWKEAILREALRRAGRVEAPEIEVVAGPPLEYRNRIQLHVEGSRIGYFRSGSHVLQPVMQCPIAAPLLNEALAHLRQMGHQPRFPKFLRSIELFTNGERVQVNVRETGAQRVARSFFDWCGKHIPGAADATLEYAAAGGTFRVGHRSFFQVNRFLIDRLVQLATAGESGELALDLFAGVGLFSLPLARRFGRVVAAEAVRAAAADLEFNAGRAELPVEVQCSTAEMFLATMTGAPELVVADPPRSGLGKGVVRELLRLRPRRLTIVSCEPPTLGRDLAPLLAGGYQFESLTLIDLFPQTYHIEAVAKLQAGNSRG